MKLLLIILYLSEFSSFMALLSNNNECKYNPCLNKSTRMQISLDQFTCICLPNYSGVYCQFKNELNKDINVKNGVGMYTHIYYLYLN